MLFIAKTMFVAFICLQVGVNSKHEEKRLEKMEELYSKVSNMTEEYCEVNNETEKEFCDQLWKETLLPFEHMDFDSFYVFYQQVYYFAKRKCTGQIEEPRKGYCIKLGEHLKESPVTPHKDLTKMTDFYFKVQDLARRYCKQSSEGNGFCKNLFTTIEYYSPRRGAWPIDQSDSIHGPVGGWTNDQSDSDHGPVGGWTIGQSDSDHGPVGGWTNDQSDSDHGPVGGWTNDQSDSDHGPVGGWTNDQSDSDHGPVGDWAIEYPSDGAHRPVGDWAIDGQSYGDHRPVEILFTQNTEMTEEEK